MNTLLFFSLFLFGAYGWNPKRFHLIDQQAENYLFRSGVLVNNGSFALPQVKEALRLHLGPTFNTSDFFLVDVNLQTKLKPSEKQDISIEQGWLNSHPEAGQFFNWPLFGSEINPKYVPGTLRKIYAKNLKHVTHDDLPAKVKSLRAMLLKTYSKPAVIIVHCSAGEDRTGELSGSYYIKYMNMSFVEALHVDDTINHDEHRDFHCASANAFAWYCYHEYYTALPQLNCKWPKGKYCD